MQVVPPLRLLRVAAIGLLPALILSIPSTAGAALSSAALEAPPFHPDFQRVARVSCRQDSPLPRPLIDAAGCGDLLRLRARVEEGSDLSTVESRPGLAGRTALHHAVQRGDAEAVEVLLAAGANANAVDARGNTPLHLLAQRDRRSADEAVVRGLVAAGADAGLRNARKRTALEELITHEWQSIRPLRAAPQSLAGLLDEAEAVGPRKVVATAPVRVPSEPAAAEQAGQPAPEVVTQSAPAGAATAGDANAGDPASAVRATLEAWAAAWSAGDVPQYLGHYASDFRPADGKTVEAWRAQRRERVGKGAGIRVTLADVEVSVEGARAAARFVQDYRNSHYKAVDRKLVMLVRDGKDWKIVEEASGN